MADSFDYFIANSKVKETCTSSEEWIVYNSKITARIHVDKEANSKYWSFFCDVPKDIAKIFEIILDKPEVRECNGTIFSSQTVGSHETIRSDELVFTKRIFFYCMQTVSKEIRKHSYLMGKKRGFIVHIRDAQYSETRSSNEKARAFLSYDSRDEDIARSIAQGLSQYRCPVWFDQYKLKVGHSLSKSIKKGIEDCQRCIILLSNNYINNEGWAKKEFDMLLDKGLMRSNKVMPIWIDIGSSEVKEFSEKLFDIKALQWKDGNKKVINQLFKELI